MTDEHFFFQQSRCTLTIHQVAGRHYKALKQKLCYVSCVSRPSLLCKDFCIHIQANSYYLLKCIQWSSLGVEASLVCTLRLQVAVGRMLSPLFSFPPVFMTLCGLSPPPSIMLRVFLTSGCLNKVTSHSVFETACYHCVSWFCFLVVSCFILVNVSLCVFFYFPLPFLTTFFDCTVIFTRLSLMLPPLCI